MDDDQAPLAIVSADGHVGPLLATQLREYCPKEHLEAFDDFVIFDREVKGGKTREELMAQHANYRTDGHHDPGARLRDLDADKVAAEILFHGSQNMESIPFQVWYFFGQRPEALRAGRFSYDNWDLELASVGMRIYNRWLADFCSVAPERLLGLAHLPMWDVDQAVAELRFVAELGLTGINFPTMRPGVRPYNDPVWEPFWSACEERGVFLATHSGAGDETAYGSGPDARTIQLVEGGGFLSQRLIAWLVFSGVFERHPGLRLVLSETPGDWWPYLMKQLDSAQAAVGPRLSRTASEYCRSNVFHGATFISRDEARAAAAAGYDSNVLWGSDYPHVEGTWQNTGDGTSTSVHQLRWAMGDLPTASMRRMCGENAIDVFGLSRDRVHMIARQLDAPSPRDLREPLEAIPSRRGMFAYRTIGPFA